MTCKRLLDDLGVACDVIAPSLIPVAPATGSRPTAATPSKLVRLYRAGELTFVRPPTPEQEGLRDLVRCRDDLRCARTAARHRVVKQLLRYGHVYRDGKKAWTKRTARGCAASASTIRSPRALEHMLAHLDSLDAQIAAIDHAARRRSPPASRWSDPVALAVRFRGISTLTALGLLAEIGDFRRFGHPRELMSFLGLTPSRVLLRRPAPPRAHHQDRQPPRPPAARRGRLALPAPPRLSARAKTRPTTSRPPSARAPGRPRSACTTATATSPDHGKRSTVANVAVARELAGFLWAAMTHHTPQRPGGTPPDQPRPLGRGGPPPLAGWGPIYAIPDSRP